MTAYWKYSFLFLSFFPVRLFLVILWYSFLLYLENSIEACRSSQMVDRKHFVGAVALISFQRTPGVTGPVFLICNIVRKTKTVGR